MNRDTVFLRGLEVRTVIGVEAWERREPQTVLIDFDVACDADRAAERDDVRDAVNHRTLRQGGPRLRGQGEVPPRRDVRRPPGRSPRPPPPAAVDPLRVAKPGAVRFSREVGIEIVRIGSRD